MRTFGWTPPQYLSGSIAKCEIRRKGRVFSF
jgi:hypothetical protein